ncbi:MAG TPA: DUF4019 domain-containing protein [Pyrinomonadaceae bacterium]|nr:DUF4019 domain-containing protein [Pyrinomonadaceae bacterium]
MDRAVNSSPIFRALLLLTFALAACSVDERRRMPAEAQATIDRVTEEIASGRDEQIYREAAEEWRAEVPPEESGAALRRVRERLGRVQSRAMYSGVETGGESSPPHTLTVTYQTTFERATGMETFRLLKRDGRWLLAGYTVTSDALR